jgi:D-alanine transaminase
VATNAFKGIDDVRAAGASAVTQPDTRWSRCNVKTIQLLPNVLAKQVAAEAGAFEALFVRDGVLMEGTHSNLFAVLDDELRTHPADEHILPGITREVVLELAAELGIPVREEPITEQDLPAVQELFVSGTTTDVLPIVMVDGRRIADGKPGEISMRLYEALVARMQGVGARA